MTFLQNVLRVLDISMETPGLYGWFHLLSLVLTAVAAVFLCRYAKNPPKVIFTVTVTVIALEIYKQINFSFSYSDGISFDYAWYAFPFQFCSTPMYAGLLAVISGRGRVHRAACAYLATYSMFAGICVMLYPSTVFVDTIGINIQTMICHGSMIAVGVYLLYSGYVPIAQKTVLRALPVFLVCVALASVMNEIAMHTGLLETDSFNMFFISPYCQPSLPVYSLVQEVVAFPLCLVIYVAAFSLAAYLVLLAAMTIRKLYRRHRTRAASVIAD